MEEIRHRCHLYTEDNSVPTHKELCEMVTPHFAAHWLRIGVFLDIYYPTLEIIQSDCSGNCQKCCDRMLAEWLTVDTNASWQKLRDSIESAMSNGTSQKIQKAGRNLKNHYKKRTRFIDDDEWPCHKPKCFTSVALVQHRDREKSKNEIVIVNILRKVGAVRTVPKTFDKHRHPSLRYNLKPYSLEIAEEVLKSSNIVKNVGDIFQSRCSKVMLIEGAPGIGKTYLCKEIAYQWSQEQLLTERKLLFFLPLCDRRVQFLTSVKDLVAYSCQQENIENIDSITKYLLETEGESLVLLLDGYNEVSEKLPYYHFIHNIVKRRHGHLSECMVVITSQSSACASLYNFVDCRIEILGFTENDRQEYITQALRDSPSDIAEVKKYFGDDHLTISSLCYIPLNMAIFLHLFKQNECPKTYTELYKTFIESMVKYHMNKVGQPHEKLQTLVNTIIFNLGKFSYNVLCKDQMIFSVAEIEHACPDIVALIPGAKYNGFGLLQFNEHFGTVGPEKTFTITFAHSSIRDCLAALYIMSLSDDKQIILLKDTFWSEKYLTTWIMFVGLTQGKTIAFKAFLSGKQSIRRSRGSSGSKRLDISSEIMNDKIKCLHLFQCFKEASDADMYQSVGESLKNDQIDLSGKTLLPNHVNTLAFFLVQSRRYTSSWDKLDISNSNMLDFNCFILLKALNSQEPRICIKKIDLSYNKLTAASAGTLATLVQKCGTEELAVTGNRLENEGAQYFLSSLVGNTTLKLLMMDDNNITSNVADEIESELISTTSLQIVGITSHQLYVRNEFGSSITEVLQQYSTLTKFSMSYCSVSVVEMTGILKLLANNVNLNTIHFSHNDLGTIKVDAYAAEISALSSLSSFTIIEPEMPSIAADELLDAANLNMNARIVALSDYKLQAVQTPCMEISHLLQSNPSIEILEIPKFHPHDEVSMDLLMTAIKATPLLQSIDVSQNNLSTVGVQKFADAIKNTASLKSLIMRSNDINGDAAKALADALQNKHSLEVLDLGENKIKTEGAIKLSQALQNNTALQVLNLHNNAIETPAAEEICLMLTNKTKLLKINISQNNFRSEGIIITAKALQTISSLKIVNLSFNKITCEASNHISAVLRNNLSLESLNVSHNELKKSGCEIICKALKHQHHNLKIFNFGCNKIQSDAAHSIAHALKGKHNLEIFSMHGNNLDTGITTIISELKSTTKKLKELNLSNSCRINQKAAQKLCKVIHENPLLEVLDISSTQLQRSGAANIFSELTNNRTLQVLNASYNQIDDAAVECLKHSLSNNSSLRELRLHGNPLSDKAIEQIVTKINTTSLRHISVQGCLQNLWGLGQNQKVGALCRCGV